MSSIKTFPILYGVDKNGKKKVWKIEVENKGDYSEIRCCYGFEEGKKVSNSNIVNKGKNIGKKNETTHFQQAIEDAQSKWKKKREGEGYIETDTLKVEKASNAVEHYPMLAQEYKKHSKKVKFPCYIQPKLDGYRMIYNPETKKVTTRTGKEFTIIYGTELYNELTKFNVHFDGELYTHNPDFLFEDYGVLRKQKGLTSEEKEKLSMIEYHVYDILDTTLPFTIRHDKLREALDAVKTNKIKLVETKEATSEEHIEELHQMYIQNRYEGSMIRNKSGMYVPKYRSHDLLKKKDFDDSEFKIIGYTSEKNHSKNGNISTGLVVWICDADGMKFNVRPKGSESERSWLLDNGDEFVGKKLWVKYFGFTDNRIPRFPTTARDTYKDYIRVVVE